MASGELCLILNMQDIMNYDFRKIIHNTQSLSTIETNIFYYKKILIVDDSVTTRTTLKNILECLGCGIDIVSSAKEGLSKLQETISYDLIITDIEMPEINGYEFIRQLKNNEMYMDIPIVVLTSCKKEKVTAELNDIHIDGYISKANFDQNHVVNFIKNIIMKFHNK